MIAIISMFIPHTHIVWAVPAVVIIVIAMAVVAVSRAVVRVTMWTAHVLSSVSWFVICLVELFLVIFVELDTTELYIGV